MVLANPERHIENLLKQERHDITQGKELLIEARNHAKLTQNLSLVRRIDAWFEKVGML